MNDLDRIKMEKQRCEHRLRNIEAWGNELPPLQLRLMVDGLVDVRRMLDALDHAYATFLEAAEQAAKDSADLQRDVDDLLGDDERWSVIDASTSHGRDADGNAIITQVKTDAELRQGIMDAGRMLRQAGALQVGADEEGDDDA